MAYENESGPDLASKSFPGSEQNSNQKKCIYVGNAAWAHVRAARCLLTKPEVTGGQCYNITDDTPLQSLNASLLN